MESLSRPFHRRKLSNANSFSGKNAYDGVFSGHRPKFNGVPAVNIEEYREIFSSGQAASSIPVLDLPTLQESSDGSNLEPGSTKPDYGKIFGGFRDEDTAVSYEDLVSRHKARAPRSTSQSSQDLGDDDLSSQSFDAMKQFNMSYNKISKRSENGLDGTTHVTQLQAVPGFTCFIDESASQPKKETKKQKSLIPNKAHSPEKQTSQTAVESKTNYHQDEKIADEATFQPKMETEKKKSSEIDNEHHLNSSKGDFPKKQTSQNDVESRSKCLQDESLKNSEKFEVNIKLDPSRGSSPPAASANEKQKVSVTDDFPKKQNSKSDFEFRGIHGEDELSSDDRISKKFEADMNLHSSRGPSSSSSSSPSPSYAASASNVDEHKDYEKRSIPEEFSFSSNCFVEELDVNSLAGASTAALRKAIEKAQESIRIAKESVGRKKEGLKSFSSKSFKDSLKVKARRVANVSRVDEQKEKDNRVHEIFKARVANVSASQGFSESKDGEKLFGAKKVINEIHEKIMESSENPKIPFESFCEFKEVEGEKERPFEEAEKDTSESLKKDNASPDGFFVLERCENKDEVGPSKAYSLVEESGKFPLNQKLEEDEKNVSEDFDQNGYEKRLNEGLGLLEITKKEVFEEDNDEVNKKVVEEEEEDTGEKFYDVCEVEIIENSSSDYDDAEESESIHGCHGGNRIVIDTQEACKVDQSHSDDVSNSSEQIREDTDTDTDTVDDVSDSSAQIRGEDTGNDVELSQEVDDVSDSSAEIRGEDTGNDAELSKEVDDVSDRSAQVREEDIGNDVELSKEVNDVGDSSAEIREEESGNDVELSKEVDDVSISSMSTQVTEDTEEKEIHENIYANQIASKDNDELAHCRLADKEQNDVKSESESSSSSHGMEIEVKEYKENEENIKKEEQEEERLEIKEKDEQKRIKEVTNEERERERNRLAAERAIREARERAFNEARERAAVERATAEVRQRVMADAQEKAAMKASDMKSSKLKAERAAVERATSEARQRALEKAMSQTKVSEPRIQVNDVRQTSSDLHISNGTSVESALRSKAKLEKHNRIMERAAKALAEKEKRDQLVQKEQAERSRLSENLDADIKRWSTGKEGNLRALLSTLQYILGPESGWQSVSLTEIITTSAVKKAYRKATLCVHPDKLQQRGASIQQKYICEKVFDLLKAAWNRFNSEER